MNFKTIHPQRYIGFVMVLVKILPIYTESADTRLPDQDGAESVELNLKQC